MVILKNSRILRGPASTADRKKVDGETPTAVLGEKRGSIKVFAAIPSKGGGETLVEIEIARTDFHLVIARMLQADERFAKQAIEKALNKGPWF